MKKELLKLLEEFQQAVDDYNSGKVGQKLLIDEEAEPTVSNLLKWLRREIIAGRH